MATTSIAADNAITAYGEAFHAWRRALDRLAVAGRKCEDFAPEYCEAERAADAAAVKVAHARLALDRRWNACTDALRALDGDGIPSSLTAAKDEVYRDAQRAREILRSAVSG